MTETKKKFLWWWPWQTDKVENMLESMAAQGWHTVYVHKACTSFVFQKGEPLRVRYCIDYQEKERPDYAALLSNAGWSLVHKESGWYIWSKAYDGEERPELFTDMDSLIRRNNLIMGSTTAIFAAQIPLFVVNINNLDAKTPFGLAFVIFWALVAGVMGFTVIGMAAGIAKMKRRARERK